MPWEQFMSLFERSSDRGYRSSAVAHNTWTIVALGTMLLSGQAAGLPERILWLLSGLLCLAVGNLVATQWYLAIRKPDYLRSERYVLTMQAMQKRGWRGDDLAGFVEALGGGDAREEKGGGSTPAGLPAAPSNSPPGDPEIPSP